MWAGERLRLAGCSSGRSVCARGGWSARRGWFRCGVYVRITPAVCRIAPNRTACGMFRSCSAVGRDRHSCVLRCRVVIGLCWFTSGLCVSLWRSRRRTKGREGRRTESAARQSAFLRDRIGFAVFSAGNTLGRNVEAALRPRPRLRQRAIGSLDSLHLIRDVGALDTAKDTRVQRRLARVQ